MLFESGIRNRRTEFVVETTEGETPADPAWEAFSDRIISVSPISGVDYAVDRAVGNLDPAGIERGPEDHEFAISYRLQRWLVDGAGDPQDAAGYGLLRGDDNELQGQTHTIVDREDRSSGGNDAAGVRLYKVVKGGFIGTVAITLDPDTGEPVPVELSYTAEKIRSYAIHQPSASTTLEVSSSSADDTTQTLTIEDEGAGTTEDVSLNGTSAVTTTATFADIDAASLDAETVGDVTITDGSGTTLMVIRGSDSYDGIEGDLGVPALGSGSHASAIGSAFEKFLSHQIDRGGSAIALDIVSAEIEVDNGLETNPRAGTYRRRIVGGQRTSTLSANLVSETRSHDALEDHLRGTEEDIVWTADGGTVTLQNTKLTDYGDPEITADLILLAHDSEFEARGLAVASS